MKVKGAQLGAFYVLSNNNGRSGTSVAMGGCV